MKRNVILSLSLIVIGSFVYLPVALGRYPAETQWGLPEGAIARLGKGRITEVQYSPDGMWLAVASSIGIWVYDAETRGPLNLLSGHTDRVSSVSYSGTGTHIASGGGWPDDKTVRVWDATTGKLLHTLTGHMDRVTSVAYSRNYTRVASGSDDGTVLLWDLAPDTLRQR